MQCPTVKVVAAISDENPQGFIVINESDLTEDHELFEPADSEQQPVTRPAKKSAKKAAE